MNYDYPIPLEGAMAKNYLRQMEQDARRLRKQLGDHDDLPGWVNAYIYTSADRLQTASRYMNGKIAEFQPAKRNPMAGGDSFRFWPVALLLGTLGYFAWKAGKERV